MPELPEVETVKRGLARTIVGKTISSVDIRVPKIFSAKQETVNKYLISQTVTNIDRRAKIILIKLSNHWTLAIHLKMTGQLLVKSKEQGVRSNLKTPHSLLFTPNSFTGGHPEKVYNQSLPHKHTHVMINFNDGATLYYNDLRKFGWLRLVSDVNCQLSDVLGPEPLSKDFTASCLESQLIRRKSSIKSILLNQSIIAGIGNIYADEALFKAKINPNRHADKLSTQEVTRLVKAIKSVLKLGIKYGGTTFSSYRNVNGENGRMKDHLKVYGRKGLHCFICNAIVVKQKIGQRSAHFCSNCQH